jgi:hypothetical protein
MKWYWLSHYRKGTVTEKDLEYDKDLLNYFIKSSDKKVQIPSDFKGFEVSSLIADIIELSADEIFNFD